MSGTLLSILSLFFAASVFAQAPDMTKIADVSITIDSMTVSTHTEGQRIGQPFSTNTVTVVKRSVGIRPGTIAVKNNNVTIDQTSSPVPDTHISCSMSFDSTYRVIESLHLRYDYYERDHNYIELNLTDLALQGDSNKLSVLIHESQDTIHHLISWSKHDENNGLPSPNHDWSVSSENHVPDTKLGDISLKITFAYPSAVKEAGEVSGTGLFPNPTSGPLTFSFQHPAFSIDIYSMTGMKIKHIPINNINTSSFDVSELPDGLYYCKAQSGANREIRKFIVRK